MEEMEKIIFQLITYSGSARSYAFEALSSAKRNDFKAAEDQLKSATSELNFAHIIQTKLIHQEMSGQEVEIGLLLVHAQDHLMTAILAKDLIEQMIEMQKQIFDLKTY